jgi:hypothetical protein
MLKSLILVCIFICFFFLSTNAPGKNQFDPEIKTLQIHLNELGFNVGKADGFFGSKTKSVLEDFQRKQNLEVTGVNDSPTKQKLKVALSEYEKLKGNYTATSDEFFSWETLKNKFHWNGEDALWPCCGRSPCQGVEYSCCPTSYKGNFCIGNIEYDGMVKSDRGSSGIKVFKNTVITYLK